MSASSYCLSSKDLVKNPDAFSGHACLKNPAWDSLSLMEQHAIVRFFTLKKLSAKDIRAELERVYGHEALSLLAVKEWRKHFTNERINLEDDTRSERPSQGNLCESARALAKESHFIPMRAYVSEPLHRADNLPAHPA
jgi:hypothetical protein